MTEARFVVERPARLAAAVVAPQHWCRGEPIPDFFVRRGDRSKFSRRAHTDEVRPRSLLKFQCPRREVRRGRAGLCYAAPCQCCATLSLEFDDVAAVEMESIEFGCDAAAE